MKFLAIEQNVPGAGSDQCRPYLRAEAERAWELYASGVLRELFFRADREAAVFMMECSNRAEAEGLLATLPLVREGLIRFDVIPLVPYPGFRRLFGAMGTES
jgi:muconolactone delta-isomerase